jgi:hypothetical protein
MYSYCLIIIYLIFPCQLKAEGWISVFGKVKFIDFWRHLNIKQNAPIWDLTNVIEIHLQDTTFMKGALRKVPTTMWNESL